MSHQCNINGCKYEAHKNNAECVLHCRKNDYPDDFRNSNILHDFYEKLIDYIVDYTFEYGFKKENSQIDKISYRDYLKDIRTSDEIVSFSKNKNIAFNKIFFPCRDSRDHFDFFKILKKIKGAHFNYCEFTTHSIHIENLETFFQDCKFHQYWTVTKTELLKNVNNVTYQQCTFLEDVSVSDSDSKDKIIVSPLFNDCTFEKELSFEDISLLNPIFNNTNHDYLKINRLIIRNCKIDKRFILNKIKSEYVLIKNTEFNAKFEFKENIINDISFINTNFYGLFDSFNAKFGKFYSFKNIFSDFVGFEQCIFGHNTEEIALFRYVTFLSFVNFRSATFNFGLDLKNINIKEPPNFLNIQLLSKQSNRETLRIIKNSFDKIGNHIEANKFFVLEMNKYKEELANKSLNQEKIIFWLNEKTSNFGQNFILPIFWICIFSVLYYFLILSYENNFLYKIIPSANDYINWISTKLNSLASNVIPFAKVLKKGMEFISLIFYVIFASLIWQTIMAVKRHTKR